MALDFEAEVIASLGLTVQREELDLVRRALRLRAARPLAKVDFTVFADTGAVLDRGSQRVSPASTDVRLAWGGAAGEVLKIQLVATDQDGIHEDLELAPWSYAIPHEEVEFETGKWDIRPEQTPKLDRSFALLAAGLAKYGKLLPVKLYVAGMTDTVSTPGTNQQLSEQRALAIARYLRAKGFGHPIFYLGLGERALKVPTADEVDEPRNRRAEYVLAAEPPAMGVGASALWKAVP